MRTCCSATARPTHPDLASLPSAGCHGRYLFFHMRHGIFVMIRRNKVVMFVPFVNSDFTNLWGETLQVTKG